MGDQNNGGLPSLRRVTALAMGGQLDIRVSGIDVSTATERLLLTEGDKWGIKYDVKGLGANTHSGKSGSDLHSLGCTVRSQVFTKRCVYLFSIKNIHIG